MALERLRKDCRKYIEPLLSQVPSVVKKMYEMWGDSSNL